MSGAFDWFDAQPRGGYRMVLAYDDATTVGKSETNTDVVEVRFQAVDPPARLVEEADFASVDPQFCDTRTLEAAAQHLPARARSGQRVELAVPAALTSPTVSRLKRRHQ